MRCAMVPSKIRLSAVLLMFVQALASGCKPPQAPTRPSPVMHGRQVAAMYSLSQVRAQQMLAMEKRIVDQDRDGRPEFLLLGELAGDIVPRGTWRKTPLQEPFLTSGYKTGGKNGKGFAARNGYYFRIYLPENLDKAGDDRTLGGTATEPGPQVRPEAVDLQEKYFAIYAWPAWKETIPQFAVAFFMNEKGFIYRQLGTKYIGEENPPPAEAAYSGHVFTSDVDTAKWQPLYGTPENK